MNSDIAKIISRVFREESESFGNPDIKHQDLIIRKGVLQDLGICWSRIAMELNNNGFKL